MYERSLEWKGLYHCNSSKARGQQEGLQYGGGSSGTVESSVAQMERLGMM